MVASTAHSPSEQMAVCSCHSDRTEKCWWRRSDVKCFCFVCCVLPVCSLFLFFLCFFSGTMAVVLSLTCDLFAFVSPRRYITAGSLRQQVVYPMSESDVKFRDGRIRVCCVVQHCASGVCHVARDHVTTTCWCFCFCFCFLAMYCWQTLLDQMELTFLYEESTDGLDRVETWQDMLSGGEQQRLGFARLLFHRPAYAIMVRVPHVAIQGRWFCVVCLFVCLFVCLLLLLSS